MATTLNEVSNYLSQDDRLERVSNICASVNFVKNNRELLEVSLKQILELFDAKRGSIFIVNENQKELSLKVSFGMQADERRKMVKRLGEGVVGRVAEIKKPIVVDDIAIDHRFKNFKPRSSYRTPSFICAPLLIKDMLIGVINVADKTSGHRFNKDELQLLDFLATQIALNYRRLQLYQKFKHIVKESRSLKNELGKSAAEAKHLRKQIVLQEKYASIGKLAGGIAHEFNNPLDGVIRYTNLSLEHLKDDEIVRGYLLEVKNGLNRMANIVKSLLACSRSTPIHAQKIDINQAVEQVLRNLQSELARKDIRLQKKLSNNMPMVTDLGIELVISNLIRNAIDAIDKKGTIEILSFVEGDYIVIQTSDSGCGIAPYLIEQIFEPFYTTKDIDKGCGLGLTIVSEITKAYNGKIKVSSLPQKGATFTVYIPKIK